MRARTRTVAIDIAGRTPPHDEGAEASVLSAILTSGAEVLERVRAEGLKPEHMYLAQHRQALDAMYVTADEGHPVDMATVASTLQRRGLLQAVGGITYLTHVADACPAIEHIEAHARIVLDLARRRVFLEQLAAAQGRAWSHTGTTDEMVADAMSELDAVADHGAPGLVLAWDAVQVRLRELQEQWDGTRARGGLPSSLPGLDPILGGYRLKGVSVLAAPTGGGKSSAAMQEVLGIAGTEYNGERIGACVVSLEMDASENVDRAIAIMSGVGDKQIQSGEMDPREQNAFHGAMNELAQKPIWFETSEVDMHGIRAAWRKADREMRGHGEGRRVRFVLVDFLGLVKLDDAERHDIALTNLTRGLKLFAMAENVHVMILCQLNRGAAMRDPWSDPQLSDLKDSSGTEQNANQVIFVHRVEVEGAEDYAGIVVAKNRKGAKGRVVCRFDGGCYRFVEAKAHDIERWKQAREASKTRRRRK